jgi:hypothetical protein
VAQAKIVSKATKLKIEGLVQIEEAGRAFIVRRQTEAWEEAAKLDGAVLKTDLTAKQCSKEVIHGRYKDLAQVEWAFRTSKTVELEMRPVYLRLADRTSAHALVVMLAYRIIKELAEGWHSLNITVAEGLRQLETLCTIEVRIDGRASFNQIPQPRPLLQNLLDLAQVRLPEALPSKGITVATRKQLQNGRKSITSKRVT